MSITLKQLEAFIWVADLGSFGTAAQRLNTTQPNISARINTLEGLIDTPLFERSKRKVRLTSRGQQLLAQARCVLAARDQFALQANEKLLTDGHLRLGVTEMIVHTWLRRYIQNIKARFPNLDVEITVEMAADLDRLLHERMIDLTLMNKPLQYPATVLDLGRYPIIWVASPTLALTGPITQSALLAHPILTHARGTSPYMTIADHFKNKGARLVPSSNLATCLQMAVDGMGIAALPAAMVKSELNAGNLVALDYAWQPDDMEFAACFAAEKAPQYIQICADIAVQTAKDI